jgi:membrane protease YdiL (CAAX protease family)
MPVPEHDDPNKPLGIPAARAGATGPPPLPAPDDTREPTGIDEDPVAPGDLDLPFATVAARQTRFCRTCGAPWEPSWAECPGCARRAAAAAGAPATASAFAQDVRSVKSAVALYFTLLAVSLVAILIVLVGKEDLGVVGDLTLGAIFSAVVVAWCLASPRLVLPSLSTAGPFRWYALAPAAAVCTYFAASSVVTFLDWAFGLEHLTYSDPYITEGYGFGWVVLSVCVQPGVFEELAFRGVIQTSLTRVLGAYESLFTTTLMFGILHLSIPSMPHLCFIGLVLGWMRLKSGSLYPGMLMHFTHNFLVVLSEGPGSIWPW